MSETIEKHWLGRNIVFLTVLIYLILRLLFTDLLSVNEHDVLAVGKQFANPSWIPADWYLNLDSGYRHVRIGYFSGGAHGDRRPDRGELRGGEDYTQR